MLNTPTEQAADTVNKISVLRPDTCPASLSLSQPVQPSTNHPPPPPSVPVAWNQHRREGGGGEWQHSHPDTLIYPHDPPPTNHHHQCQHHYCSKQEAQKHGRPKGTHGVRKTGEKTTELKIKTSRSRNKKQNKSTKLKIKHAKHLKSLFFCIIFVCFFVTF